MANAIFIDTIRVFYKKLGRMKYISHLDMNRCVSRALKRTRLPVWHTLGFNPHIYVTFALPLSLGCESECESFDFRLTEQISSEEIVKLLNEALPEEIIVYRAQSVVRKPEDIAWADYDVNIGYVITDGAHALESLEEWFALPEMPVVKKGKKGEHIVDAKEYVQILGAKADGRNLFLSMRCAAGTSMNLNPTLILDTFSQSAGGPTADRVRILRKAIYTADMQNFE